MPEDRPTRCRREVPARSLQPYGDDRFDGQFEPMKASIPVPYLSHPTGEPRTTNCPGWLEQATSRLLPLRTRRGVHKPADESHIALPWRGVAAGRRDHRCSHLHRGPKTPRDRSGRGVRPSAAHASMEAGCRHAADALLASCARRAAACGVAHEPPAMEHQENRCCVGIQRSRGIRELRSSPRANDRLAPGERRRGRTHR